MNRSRILDCAELQTGRLVRTSTLVGVQCWFTPGRFAWLLACLIVAFYPQVIFGVETFYYRDYATFGYPLAHYHRNAFWRGELPVWNSLNSCGLPYLAQWNTMTLYPLSLIYLLLPLPWSLSFFCLAHLFLAGLGMYLLANSWTKNSFAAAVAGTAFAFNGLTQQCLMWPNNIAGLAWMPLVVLCAKRGWRDGGRSMFLAGLIGGIQMLTGSPEVIAFTWIVVMALFGMEWLSMKAAGSRALLRIAVTIGLTVGLAAAQLLPFIDLLAHSQRSSSYGVQSWAMPVWGWLNLVLPNFRATLSNTGTYFQYGQSWTSSYYPGVAVLVLALLAVRMAPSKRIWTLWGVAIFGLVMALGERGFLYSWTYKVAPFLGFIRYPIKFVLLSLFVLPILAAYAVAAVESVVGDPEKQRLTWRWMIILSGGVTALVATGMFVSSRYPYGDSDSSFLLNGIVRVLFLALTLAIFALLTCTRRHQLLLQSAVILILVLDVWTHMPNQNPTISSTLYETNLVARQLDPKCASGEDRAFLCKSAYDLLLNRAIGDQTKDLLGRRAGLFGNLNLLDGVPTPDGCYSLFVAPQRQIWRELFFAHPTNFPSGLADFLAIRQISTDLFDWQLRPSTQPLVTAGARPVFVDDKGMLNRLSDPRFNPRETVYFTSADKPNVSVTNSSVAHITKTTHRAGHITADIDASEATLMVVAEAYYDGWHAEIDYKPTRILRANSAFQAIEVPAGRHYVELHYRERYLFTGAMTSSFTFAGCLFGCVRKRKGIPASPS
jgi:hypothetical protein